MKALWLIPSFWPAHGGIETLGWHLALGLCARGHEILIVTDEGRPPAPPFDAVAGVTIIRLPAYVALAGRNPSLVLQLQRRLSMLAAEFAPDLLHLHLVGATPMGLFALQLQRHNGTPLLATMHDDMQQLRATPDTLLGQCFERAAWITTDSPTFLADVRQALPHRAPFTSTIAPGLPPVARPPQPCTPGNSRFLYLGRLAPEKGIDLAIAALAEVVAEYPMARLAIAGDGPLAATLRAQAADLGIADAVEFCGPVTEAEREHLIDSALALLMPSRHREGFGLVALEAAQRGRPVIAAEAGALGATVAQLGNGLVVPQEDVAALAGAMRRLLTAPSEANALGQAALARATQQFDLAASAAAYDAIYRHLAQKP